MGLTLVVAEKPSVCNDIAKVIGATTKKPGCYVGNGYIVTHCVGHLVTLAEPEEYGDDFQGDWKKCFDSLPLLPDHYKTKVINEVKNQYTLIKKLMESPDVSDIIVATDAGREGQLIYGLVAEKVQNKKPEKRLWISSMTDEAIKTGMSNLRNNKEYETLLQSAYCRSKADWLIGMNFTRYFSVLYHAFPPLSVGRVQTPTLAMIVNRQKEIESFISTPFWEVEIEAGGIVAKWFDKDHSRFTDKVLADNVTKRVRGKTAIVTSYEVADKVSDRPRLYDLNELQKDANDIYGYTLDDVLNSVQRLYEYYKVSTYPRTDSRCLTDDMKPLIPERLKHLCSIDKYKSISQNLLTTGYLTDSLIFDNSKVSDHHAIIITEKIENFSFEQVIESIRSRGGDNDLKIAKSLDKYKEMDQNILHLIITRFLTTLSPKMKYKETNLVLASEGETFSASCKIITDYGYKRVQQSLLKDQAKENDAVPGEQLLSGVSKGMSFIVNQSNLIEKKTTPPKYFTDKTIITAMQHPASQIDEEELKEMVKGYELGTTATRSEIIKKLIRSEYIKRDKKKLVATEKGIKLIQLLPDELKSPELTAKWEYSLSLVEKGELLPDAFMNSIEDNVKSLIEEIRTQIIDETAFSDNHSNTIGKCPLCGADVVEYPKSFGCSNWNAGCNFKIWKDDKRISFYSGKKPTKANVSSLLQKGYFTCAKEGQYGKYNIKISLQISNGKETFILSK